MRWTRRQFLETTALASGAVLMPACTSTQTAAPLQDYKAIPQRTWLIAGQSRIDLGAATGNDGYLDHVTATPDGFTLYGTFPDDAKPVDLHSLAWIPAAEVYLQMDRLKNAVFHFSLAWVPEAQADTPAAIAKEKRVLAGDFDWLIDDLAKWCDAQQRPILLRLGYEFNRIVQKLYTPENYAPVFRRVVERFRALGVQNVSFVWASANLGFSPDKPGTDDWDFNAWYPGDQYVDWYGFSMWFPKDWDTVMLAAARKNKKPLILAETTPSEFNVAQKKHYPFLGKTGTDLTVDELWNGWWQPMIDFVAANQDVIRAWHYIAADWKGDPMWNQNPYFKYCDAQVWKEPALLAKWEAALRAKPFV